MIAEKVIEILHKAFDANCDFILVVKDLETREIHVHSNTDRDIYKDLLADTLAKI